MYPALGSKRHFEREMISGIHHVQITIPPGAETEAQIRNVFLFIGADPAPFDTLDVGRVNSAAELGPPLNPLLAEKLRERMAPSVERLARLTGLDLGRWGYQTARRAA